MKTDRLIEALAADNEWRAPDTSKVLLGALALALPVSIAAFLIGLAPRPDWRQAMGNPFFDFKFVITFSLALVALLLALRLARPGMAAAGRGWLLLIPLMLAGAGIIADLVLTGTGGWTTRLVGSNSKVCLTAIPLLSLPLLAAGLLALRHGATTRPAMAGAVAGLLAGGLAATLYASHCTDDSPLFVATWYTLALAVVTALGAAIGSRVLRF